MKPPFPTLARRAQKGAVAVEAAVCMAFVLVPLLAFVLLFGKFFWYYTASQKAVHDASLYLAGAPLSELKSLDAVAVANDIMAQEIADFDPDTGTGVSVECGYKIGTTNILRFRACSESATPVAVQASLFLAVHPFFFSMGGSSSGTPDILILSAMPYVGR